MGFGDKACEAADLWSKDREYKSRVIEPRNNSYCGRFSPLVSAYLYFVFQFMEEFTELEQSAKKQGLGLWGFPHFP
jgi:hypothetical protein